VLFSGHILHNVFIVAPSRKILSDLSNDLRIVDVMKATRHRYMKRAQYGNWRRSLKYTIALKKERSGRRPLWRKITLKGNNAKEIKKEMV